LRGRRLAICPFTTRRPGFDGHGQHRGRGDLQNLNGAEFAWPLPVRRVRAKSVDGIGDTLAIGRFKRDVAESNVASARTTSRVPSRGNFSKVRTYFFSCQRLRCQRARREVEILRESQPPPANFRYFSFIVRRRLNRLATDKCLREGGRPSHIQAVMFLSARRAFRIGPSGAAEGFGAIWVTTFG